MTTETVGQRLQDHMEQHHGICLKASEWDAAALASTTPDKALLDEVREALRERAGNIRGGFPVASANALFVQDIAKLVKP